METAVFLSVIIPVKDAEEPLERLTEQLEPQRMADMQVIVCSGKDRAEALNRGAAEARGTYLWFVHADTRLDYDSVDRLRNAIKAMPDRLLYFDLAFCDDGPGLTRLNAMGANLRSRFLRAPYGDQAFCLRRDSFRRIGGFPEDVAYGEDHAFVWRARRCDVRLGRVGATIGTSARRYAQEGWLKTTLRFQKRFLAQSWSEWRRK